MNGVSASATSAWLNCPNLNLDSYERLGRKHNPPPPPQPATLSNIGCSHDSSPRKYQGRRLIGYNTINPLHPPKNKNKSSDWFPYGSNSLNNQSCGQIYPVNNNTCFHRFGYGSPIITNRPAGEITRPSKTPRKAIQNNPATVNSAKNAGDCYNRFGYQRPISTNRPGETPRPTKTAKVLQSSYFQTPKLALGCHVRLGESGDPPVVYVSNEADGDKSKIK